MRTGAGVFVVTAAGVGGWSLLKETPTSAKQDEDNAVIQWNNAALKAIGNTGTGPTVGARALAIVHTAMYDAWASYDDVAVPTQKNGIPRQKNKWKDVTEAVSFAAYRTLLDLFPSEAANFNTVLSGLGYNSSNTALNTSTPSGIGNTAAKAVLDYRHSDGSNQLGDLNTGAYSDYTGYAPVNTPDTINDPDRWQPLRMPNGTVQKFMTPHWGKVKPFALSSGDQFRPSGPVKVSQADYKAQVDAVLQLSANLTDKQKVIAEYWADGPKTVTPPGHWDLLSQFVSSQYLSRKNKHDLSTDIKLFFALTNAIFDCSIAVWECKRYYDSIRPISAVHYVYNGKTVSAWAGPGKGTGSIDGGAWKSYIGTPPFAEYVSGHSTFSSAGAVVLSKAMGNDSFGYSYTAAAGSSTIEPSVTPASAVTLSWATCTDACVEAGLSRRYGGIHFQKADEDGRTLGQKVANVAWTKAQNYIAGKA